MMKILIIVISLLIVIFSIIAALFRSVLYEPYMDEIFHVRQTKTYCEGRLTEWDPNITTPPGLYFLTITLLVPYSIATGVNITEYCLPEILRLINVVFGIACLPIFILYLRQYQVYRQSSIKLYIKSLELCLFPLHFFFCFLYYTDTSSTFFVMLMLLTSRSKSHMLLFILGVLSVFLRQNNIIWIGFILLVTIVAEFEFEGRIKHEKRRTNIQLLRAFLLWILYRMPSLIVRHISQILVLVLFVFFLIYNNGIVLGHHQYHQPRIHIPQILYFSLFTISLDPLSSIHSFFSFFRFIRSSINLFKILMIFIFITLSVTFFTYAHPFLLSDNRHFTFYLWKNILSRPKIRYSLIPIYFFSFWQINNRLSHKSFLWRISFFLSISALLIPAPLIEFRYYLIPFLIYRLNERNTSLQSSIISISLYIMINVMTIWIFLYRPFLWNDGTTARFMW